MTDYEIDLSDDPTFPIVKASNIGYLGKNVEYSCAEEYYDDYDKAKGSYEACYISGYQLNGLLQDVLKGNGLISDKCNVRITSDDYPTNSAVMESDHISSVYGIKKDKKIIRFDEAVLYYEYSDKKIEREEPEPEYCPHCGALMEEEYYEEERGGYVNITDVEIPYDERGIEELKKACL